MEMYAYVDGVKCQTRVYYLLGNLIGAKIHTKNPTAYLDDPNPNPYDYSAVEIAEARASCVTRKESEYNTVMALFNALAPGEYEDTTPGLDINPEDHTDAAGQKEARENGFIYGRFLCNYFFPKYYRAAVPPYFLEGQSVDWYEIYFNFFAKFSDRTLATFPKYVRLIKLYEAKEAELMNRLESETESLSKFNDTPQEEGDYSTDAHTTTATKATTKTATDYETPMKRLKEIRDNLEDLYNAWAEDYANLFVRI